MGGGKTSKFTCEFDQKSNGKFSNCGLHCKGSHSVIEYHLDRLAQKDRLARMLREYSPSDMVPICDLPDTFGSPDGGVATYSALIKPKRVQSILRETRSVFQVGTGLPYFESADPEFGTEAQYWPLGNQHGDEPLVIYRDFLGMRPEHIDISQEFCLFHNLFHDSHSNTFIKFDESGDEHIVIAVQDDQKLVEVRLPELRQFLAATSKHLVLQHESVIWSELTVKELGLEIEREELKKTESAIWSLTYGNSEAYRPERKTLSTLRCLRLIPPFPLVNGEIPGYGNSRSIQFVDFVVGSGEFGNDLVYTCNPQVLQANDQDGNGSSGYLTPVAFRKSVLDRYHDHPSKYSVSAGHVFCGGLWNLRIDNYHDDKVFVWLGDLGTSLPFSEQLHWRSHNFIPSSGISQTFYQNQILGQWVASNQPDHRFREEYQNLAEVCKERLGWGLLINLSDDDQNVLGNIRIPASDEQRSFDELVLGLAKVLIDSLNESKLKEICVVSGRELPTGSISRLECAFVASNEREFETHIAFLRKLQSLRSAGSAHLKGKRYRDLIGQLGLDSQDRRMAFVGLLEEANRLLSYLQEVVERNGADWGRKIGD